MKQTKTKSAIVKTKW